MQSQLFVGSPNDADPVDGFSFQTLQGHKTLTDIIDHLRVLREADAGHRFLCTLDDAGQCRYTSGHAANHTLLDVDSREVDFDDPASVQAFELRRLRHIAAQLQAPALQVDWQAVTGTLQATEDDIAALLEMNRHPLRVLDDMIYVQRLPVASDDLLIAGLPNGYFRSDWNVFQNHAVIRRLATHGYRFFGIGAATLGFVRDAGLADGDALVADLSALYAIEDETAQAELAQLLRAQTTLLLGYTEGFAETALRDDL